MAMTPAERKRRSREKKAQEAKLTGDPIDAIASVKFNEYLPEDGNWTDVLTYLEWAGIDPDAVPAFESDDDPEHDPANDGPYRGSIGRAERMVSMFLDAATTLAGIINTYKREQIETAIAKLEAGDLTDPAAKKQVFAEIVRLNRIRDRLDKHARRTMPQWKTEGA